jgi:hypothetical protein
MRNTTVTIDEKILEDARRHAGRLGCSFNAWVNKIIEDAIRRSPQKSMRELLALADKCAGRSKRKRWTRDEIYER